MPVMMARAELSTMNRDESAIAMGREDRRGQEPHGGLGTHVHVA